MKGCRKTVGFDDIFSGVFFTTLDGNAMPYKCCGGCCNISCCSGGSGGGGGKCGGGGGKCGGGGGGGKCGGGGGGGGDGGCTSAVDIEFNGDVQCTCGIQ